MSDSFFLEGDQYGAWRSCSDDFQACYEILSACAWAIVPTFIIPRTSKMEFLVTGVFSLISVLFGVVITSLRRKRLKNRRLQQLSRKIPRFIRSYVVISIYISTFLLFLNTLVIFLPWNMWRSSPWESFATAACIAIAWHTLVMSRDKNGVTFVQGIASGFRVPRELLPLFRKCREQDLPIRCESPRWRLISGDFFLVFGAWGPFIVCPGLLDAPYDWTLALWAWMCSG